MIMLVDILSWVAILGGVTLLIIGSLGVVIFPDFWSRIHAASVAESGGMILVVLGMCLQAGWSLTSVKLIAIGIFLLITGPTATHAVARAALSSGMKPPRLKRGER